MPVIAMSRPWKRPEDGKFYLRVRTPKRYLLAAKRAEFRIPLNTRDPAEAKRLMGQALVTWNAQLVGWEAGLSRVDVDQKLAKTLVSDWQSRLRRTGDPARFGYPGGLDTAREILIDADDPHAVQTAALHHADEVLAELGKPVTDESRGMVQDALIAFIPFLYSPAFWSSVAEERAFGAPRMLADPELAASMKEMPDKRGASSRRPEGDKNLSFSFEQAWQAWSSITATNARTVIDTKGVLRQMATFLGHQDAARVTKADVVRWRDVAKAAGLSNNTWNNRVASLSQIFGRAVADDRLPENPFKQARLPKSVTESRRPYTDEEAVRILRSARAEGRPSLRWAHWVMAFTGMRVAEVLQLTGSDVQTEQRTGISFIRVATDVKAGKSVKTGVTRHVPVHPKLRQEGFMRYAATIKPDEPLFPDKKVDKFGHRGGRGWNVVGVWVRDTVGIIDPRTAPNHSWRHRMEDELRAAEVYEADRDAIVGHARKTTGAKYGIRGEALSRLHAALSKVSPPEGL
jgi:integrase